MGGGNLKFEQLYGTIPQSLSLQHTWNQARGVSVVSIEWKEETISLSPTALWNNTITDKGIAQGTLLNTDVQTCRSYMRKHFHVTHKDMPSTIMISKKYEEHA